MKRPHTLRRGNPIEVTDNAGRVWPGTFIRIAGGPDRPLVWYRLHETGTLCSADLDRVEHVELIDP